MHQQGRLRRQQWQSSHAIIYEQFRDHPHFAATEEFIAKYDCPAFDPDYDSLPLAFFEPMVMKLFAQPRNSLYTSLLDTPG